MKNLVLRPAKAAVTTATVTATEKQEADAATAIQAREIALQLSPINFGDESVRTSTLSNGVGDHSYGHGSIELLLNAAMPRRKEDQIRRAIEWLGRDELLERLIGVKTDFTLTGMKLLSVPDEAAFDWSEQLKDQSVAEEKLSTVNPDTETPTPPPSRISPEDMKRLAAQVTFQSKLAKIQRKWDLNAVAENLIRDWYTTDSAILFWQVATEETGIDFTGSGQEGVSEKSAESLLPGLIDINSLSPADVDWDNSFGADILRVRIPQKLKDRINNALHQAMSRDDKERVVRALMQEGVGYKWIVAIIKGEDYVQLRNEDGEYWVIRTRARRHQGLANPSMKNIFIPLETRNMLAEGDFSAAFMMKHFIFQIKSGESITQGPLAGMKNNWTTPTEATALLSHFSKPSKAMRASTNHTVEFKFIFPPKEMFDEGRYTKIEWRIFNWAGVTVVSMTGGGTNASLASGVIGTRRLVADATKARSVLNDMFLEFFDHESIRSISGSPEDHDVVVTFNEQILKESRQLLEEIKFLVEQGHMDARTSLRELGRNPESIKISKAQTTRENENSGLWQPDVMMPGAKLIDGSTDAGGRPPREGINQNEATRNQNPGSGET